MCKFSAEESFGETPKILQGPLTDLNVAREFAMSLYSGNIATATLINYNKHGVAFINNLIGWQLGDLMIAETCTS